jgi:hypothetical protein
MDFVPILTENVSKFFDEGAEVNGDDGMSESDKYMERIHFLMSKGVLFTFSM